jgi:hypothetical protein
LLGFSGEARLQWHMLLAVLTQAGATSSAPDLYYGYPPWLVVAVGTIVVVVILWIFAKLLKWAVWILIVLVLIVGFVTAARMLIGT